MKLPASWQMKRLEKLVQFSSGGTPSKAKPEFWQGDIPWISAATMHQQEIVTSELNISEDGLKAGSKLAKENDLLLLVRGSMLWKKVPICICKRDVAFNQDVKALRINGKITPTYLLYWFLAHQRFLLNKVVGTGIGAGKFDLDELKALDIPLPPLPEQKAIADLLSTWDEAIEKTERLIQAKERRFRWLLRKLMTPATAASDECSVMSDEFENTQHSALITNNSPSAANSDFSIHNSELARGGIAKWKKVKLGDLFGKEIKVEKGKALTKEYNTEGNIPVVAGGQTYAYFTNRPTHEIPTVTVSASGAYAGFVWYHDYPIWASDCNVLRATKGVTKFLYFTLKAMQHRIYALQSGGAQPHVYSKDMKNLHISWPSTEEQQEISETLSSAQHEIDLLKQLAEQYKTQKRGLMQKMLTGEWRIAPDAVMRYE